ncbi:hypothetical protein P153DRAFT_381668 [Dothidotthia symphoricarpi CBS 119687]|uniref:PHD-type domain-containing protein n=1 Tax=Dothidotthia symphoricarpi CBS 119687 TaxID=1392245 RepID=A0A6A6AMS3_9PLEO|nr:uncharacterized protein P153DRAFT_381668 [Dothidotthia symphoricarpi CBS 119687]KAF2133229.1 hypothetical protein P153DRAFT_381668 [Dothidotthia symphoricarpi CBS 119687]
MNPPNPPYDYPATGNGAPNTAGASANMSAQTPHPSASMPPAWSAQMSTFPANNGAAGGPSFHQFSASTAAILERLHGTGGSHASGSAAFEAKKAEIMQAYVTSDKLPTPPPVPNSGRRGRGGRVGTPSALKSDAGASPATSGRGSGRGRGRGGRGRGGRRGGKRKRSEESEEEESDDDDEDSDISSSYTPLPTRTKSGRNVNKPVSFVPTIPEPAQGSKRRKSTKTLLSAKCKTCNRDTDPTNNRIVFCDSCNTAYHQFCHNPPISSEVVTVLEKEWLCGPCQRVTQHVVEGTEDLVAAENLSIDQRRAYFSTLPQHKLVPLLLYATIRHPELPIFPQNVKDLVPESATPSNHQPPPLAPQRLPPPHQQLPQYPPPNGHALPQHHPPVDPTEAQLLGEIRSNQPRTTMDLAGNQYEEDDGYDTDPPAHYPKAGQGLARTLRPESEDLNWLVDDNFEVFSHGWKGDGSGMGADGTLDGMGGGKMV